MRIGFTTRKDDHIWGGDLKALKSIADGLSHLGHQTFLARNVRELLQYQPDFIFLSNYAVDHIDNLRELEKCKIRFGFVPFYKDNEQFSTPSGGLAHYVVCCLENNSSWVKFDVENLLHDPSIVYNFPYIKKRQPSLDEILQKAELIIANSPTELNTILRDEPNAKVKVVFWAPGFASDIQEEIDDSFLKLSGLKSNSYILQVGRMEVRKNQLGSIIATKDLEFPLVFIASKAFESFYEEICIKAIKKWRKAPTIIISEDMAPYDDGHLKVIAMPGNKMLSQETLMSAFFHAGIHLHPAFQEMPGATYQEAAKVGTMNIASSWTTIKDYFYDERLGHSNLDGRIAYAEPHRLAEIRDLVVKHFGKRFSYAKDIPILMRKEVDVAKEINTHLLNVMSSENR